MIRLQVGCLGRRRKEIKVELHEIKYEARKRRYLPKDDGEIKLYQALYYQRRWPPWDMRHMEVFKNGTVAQFVNKRFNLTGPSMGLVEYSFIVVF